PRGRLWGAAPPGSARAEQPAAAEHEPPEGGQRGLAGRPGPDGLDQLVPEGLEPGGEEVFLGGGVVEHSPLADPVPPAPAAPRPLRATLPRSQPRSANSRQAVSAIAWRVCSFLRSRSPTAA